MGEPTFADSSVLWPDEDDFPGPGANSFISAVRSLSIMAEKCELWGALNPEAWALWYELAASGVNDPRIAEIQLALKRDPQAAAVQRTAWMDVASRLEATLREV